MPEPAIPTNTVRQSWDKPLVAPERIPTNTDIVIIGGGIVGISTALFLARDGINVVVCEKGHIAGEQSGRNWGWVRQQGRDERELGIMMRSIDIWQDLQDNSGEDLGFSRGGCLFAARTEDELRGLDDWLQVAKAHDLDTHMLTAAEVQALVPGGGYRWAGAMYTASDGRAEPHKATAAIARLASKAGAIILTGCAVRGLDIEAGRATGVVTEHGTIKAARVLCAGGAWTSMFCRSVGVDLPQLKVRGTVVRTAPGPDVLNGNLFDEQVGIRRREDGGYTIAPGALLDHAITPDSFRYFFKFLRALIQDISIVKLRFGRDFFDEWQQPKRWALDSPSPFEHTRALDPQPNPKAIAQLRRDIAELFPPLAEIEFVETWGGIIESTPDIVPVIDESAIEGFYIATGFSGHGFGIGPGAGQAIAEMLTERTGSIDLQPLRLTRFFDGSPIRPQSSI